MIDFERPGDRHQAAIDMPPHAAGCTHTDDAVIEDFKCFLRCFGEIFPPGLGGGKGCSSPR